MRDQHQRCTGFPIQLEQQVDDALAGHRIKAAGGFIGKQQWRAAGKGSGKGHALLLAAGQRFRVVPETFAQADPLQQRPRPGFGLRITGKLERQHHVLQRGHLPKQLKGLEHEADMRRTPRGARVLIEREQVLTEDLHPTGARQVEAGHQPQQRGLARTRCSDHGDRSAGGHRERDVFENGEFAVRITDAFDEVLDDNGRHADPIVA